MPSATNLLLDGTRAASAPNSTPTAGPSRGRGARLFHVAEIGSECDGGGSEHGAEAVDRRRLLRSRRPDFFADEAGVRSNSHHSGTTWAPMGQTPVVPATGKRFGLNLVSAVSPQGVLRFMVVDGRMTAVRFIAFLKRLLHNQTRPIFLIVDQHSSHRAKAVQEFVASTDGHLELFFLPPYSPELNPDELVWNHLKTHGVRKRLLQTPQELKRYVLGHMRSLQRTPALLRGFFKKPSLRYITA